MGAPGRQDGRRDPRLEVVAAVGEGRVAVHELQRTGGEETTADGQLQVVTDEVAGAVLGEITFSSASCFFSSAVGTRPVNS